VSDTATTMTVYIGFIFRLLQQSVTSIAAVHQRGFT
jgi:hypothetical protein